MKKGRTGILWFRRDLRLHDNESLMYATKYMDNVIPVYVFDERLYQGYTSYGFPKINTYRRKFLIQSVLNLRESLREKGSELIVRYGKTEDVLYELSKKYRADFILCNRERTSEEVAIQNNLEQKLWTIGGEILFFRGKMLFYTADMPFPIKHAPDTFSQFKKEVYKIVPIRDPLETPQFISTNIGKMESGDIPQELEISAGMERKNIGPIMIGGEKEALKKLHEIRKTLLSVDLSQINSSLFEENFTTHLSPWLSTGCLSPKLMYKYLAPFAEAKEQRYYVQKIINNLLYRDFCCFIAKKYKEKIFWLTGLKGDEYPYRELDYDSAYRFTRGLTGIPLIDAQIRKLRQTGYLTSKSRKILASFFIYDLKQPWIYGAELFESMLIDYDPTSNYGNWGILADTFYESSGNAYVNVVYQAERFDPEGKFVKRWVPELRKVDDILIHYPWKWESVQRYKWKLPESVYPEPIVTPRYSLV